ncbi:MAG: 50S ribosomal protein L22 [Bacteroidia bacterium]|jgi:large subunit ribosomal protein L22
MEAKAILRNCPLSPQKMRLVVDQVRGVNVEKALNILQFSQRPLYAQFVSKLLRSAIANWAQGNEGRRIEESNLFVKTIMVDEGMSMKRMRTAPQGRGYRIQKRSNHITIIVDSRQDAGVQNEEVLTEDSNA